MKPTEAKFLRLVLMSLTLPLCLAQAQDDWDQRCGSLCNCKWFSGKKTAECVGQKLTHVPLDLSSEIQILDLAENHIPYVPENAFSDANLVNLQKIVLRKCEIESLASRAFRGLRIVIEIDLAVNRLRKIDPGTFVETPRLRILRLNDNELEFLDDDQFQGLLYIQAIFLSHNRLVHIGKKAFSNLPGLQTLSLNGNNLSSLNAESFDYLPKLSSLDLQENPWKCDCRFREFSDWMKDHRLHTNPTRCDQPEEVNKDCRRPDIQVGPGVDLDKNGGSGDVKLWCRTVSGLPRPQLSWIHASIILKNSTERRQGSANLRGGYVLTEVGEWLNLTIPNASVNDRGDYVCMAVSSEGRVEKNVALTIAEEIDDEAAIVSLPLALGLGGATLLLILLLVTLVGFVLYRRRGSGNKSTAEGSPDHHGLAARMERGNSSIAAVNPGKLAAASHGSLAAMELNGTLAGSDSVFFTFVDSPKVSVKPSDEDRGFRASGPDGPSSPIGRGATNKSHRHLPPDLLAFRAGTGSESPMTFRTLPHNRSFGATSSHNNSGVGMQMLMRQGYVTIPRRPRPPSWGSSCSPPPTEAPLYDNLGQRTTADGSSVLSLNKSAAPVSPAPRAPGTPAAHQRPLHCDAVLRSSHNILTSSPLDRSGPEGAPGWPARFHDEIKIQRVVGNVDCRTLGRKLPPRPPPKPENRTIPLFEDEGEDGTEV